MSLLEKQHSKKVPALRHKKFNYSNLRIIDLVTKIIYPFVIISSFNGNTSGLTLSVFGLFVFNELIFWIMFPFEFREEYSQIILLVCLEEFLFMCKENIIFSLGCSHKGNS